MAKINNKTAIALMLSALLIISITEARLFDGIPIGKATSTPSCEAVLGVLSGDTCFDIIKSNKLTAEDFAAINPNLNCDALFVGQWICVVGSA